ncbi:hypothetical protein [Corynebacterium accolens]|uniref:Uncharacterized protein n=1 Tax=Corynebacterium accolens TaxID=38284 RepID=A0AAP4F7T3_9CORY|nr:hypothetical protein [Corynebacterium accolens]MDK4334026.1 hypothetical protein [Corynebacterium accolens]
MAMQKITVDVEMIDGTEHNDVRVILADMIRYSDVAQRHKWPELEKDPIRAGAFMGYAAMTRLGLYESTRGFDEFVNDVAMVSADFGDAVDPIGRETPAA